MARGDRADLVPAVGVERDQRQVGLRPPVGGRLAEVVDDEIPAGVRGRQRDDQRRDHRVVLLGVLVRQEELAFLVDQQGMQVGGQPAVPGQSEFLAQRLEFGAEALPARPLDADEFAGDLPRVADREIGERLLPVPEGRPAAEVTKLPGLVGGHRQGDRADALDLQPDVGRSLGLQLDARRYVVLGGEQVGQLLPCRGRHRSSFRGSSSGPEGTGLVGGGLPGVDHPGRDAMRFARHGAGGVPHRRGEVLR